MCFLIVFRVGIAVVTCRRTLVGVFCKAQDRCESSSHRQLTSLLFLSLIFHGLSLGFVLLVFHLLLGVLGLRPGVVRHLLSAQHAVGDDDVVEDRAGLHLPEIEADGAEVFVEVQVRVLLVFGIVDLRVHPRAFVRGVVDLASSPDALVFRIVDGGWLPGAIDFVVPVFGLLRVRVGDVLRFLPI